MVYLFSLFESRVLATSDSNPSSVYGPEVERTLITFDPDVSLSVSPSPQLYSFPWPNLVLPAVRWENRILRRFWTISDHTVALLERPTEKAAMMTAAHLLPYFSSFLPSFVVGWLRGTSGPIRTFSIKDPLPHQHRSFGSAFGFVGNACHAHDDDGIGELKGAVIVVIPPFLLETLGKPHEAGDHAWRDCTFT